MILLYVHSLLLLTLKGNTRARNLCKSIDIIRFDAKCIFDTFAHFLSPRLCAKDACLQLNLIAKPSRVDFFAEICSVGRCTAQNRRAKICHKLKLALCISRRHRQCQTAHLVRAAI